MVQGLVGRLRRAAAEGRMGGQEVALVDALERQLNQDAASGLASVEHSMLELGAHAQEAVAAGRHSVKLEAQIAQLHRENEALRQELAPGPPSLTEQGRRYAPSPSLFCSDELVPQPQGLLGAGIYSIPQHIFLESDSKTRCCV